MSGDSINAISGINLTDAWVNAFTKCYEAAGSVLSPAAVTFPAMEDNADEEIVAVRQILDKHLEIPKTYPAAQSVINSVANTIFPESIWLSSGGDRNRFYHKYRKILPLIMKCPANRRGIYFERMITYPSYKLGEQSVNQLEHVINTWLNGNHRHSALQVGIFNPSSDHTNARQQGFPCLQQISFHPNGPNGCNGLSVVAFYANQTIEEKAYGNYLGLYRLGKFMANAMGIKLKDITCIASALKLNNSLSKANCKKLMDDLKAKM